VANAAVVCSTVGKVEKTRATSGKNRSKPIRSVRPGKKLRTRTGAPGRSTRCSSAAAAGRSVMWWVTVDSHAPSTLESSTGSCSADPARISIPGVWGIRARIAADGSTASTVTANQSWIAVLNAPVPAPTSTTVIPGRGDK